MTKSELTMFGSSIQLAKVNTSCLYIGDCVVLKANTITYIGVTFDSELRLNRQITKMCSKGLFGIQIL